MKSSSRPRASSFTLKGAEKKSFKVELIYFIQPRLWAARSLYWHRDKILVGEEKGERLNILKAPANCWSDFFVFRFLFNFISIQLLRPSSRKANFPFSMPTLPNFIKPEQRSFPSSGGNFISCTVKNSNHTFFLFFFFLVGRNKIGNLQQPLGSKHICWALAPCATLSHHLILQSGAAKSEGISACCFTSNRQFIVPVLSCTCWVNALKKFH